MIIDFLMIIVCLLVGEFGDDVVLAMEKFAMENSIRIQNYKNQQHNSSNNNRCK